MMLRWLATKPSGPMAAQLTHYWRVFVDLPADRPELLEQGEDLDERMRAKHESPATERWLVAAAKAAEELPHGHDRFLTKPCGALLVVRFRQE